MSTIFKKTIELSRLLSNRSYNDGVISGNILLSHENIDLVRHCVEDSENSGCTTVNRVALNANIDVEIITPRSGRISYNLSTLLNDRKTLIKAPDEFYLFENDFYNKDGNKRPDVNSYLSTIELVETLKQPSFYYESSILKDELLFIHNSQKFSLPIKYRIEDLNLDIDQAVANIKLFIGDSDIHQKIRLSILAEVICEITITEHQDSRFSKLLSEIKNIKEQADQKYALFTSGFSYDKIKSDIEAAKIDFLGKINHVFSDIQTQLLSIPAEIIVVFSQIKESNGMDGIFWTNTAILFSALFVSVLIWLLVSNQKHTLSAVSDEIKRQKNKLSSEHSDIFPQFRDSFNSLTSRQNSQKRALCFVQIVIIAVFIASCIYYIMNTSIISQYFLACLNVWASKLPY